MIRIEMMYLTNVFIYVQSFGDIARGFGADFERVRIHQGVHNMQAIMFHVSCFWYLSLYMCMYVYIYI